MLFIYIFIFIFIFIYTTTTTTTTTSIHHRSSHLRSVRLHRRPGVV